MQLESNIALPCPRRPSFHGKMTGNLRCIIKSFFQGPVLIFPIIMLHKAYFVITVASRVLAWLESRSQTHGGVAVSTVSARGSSDKAHRGAVTTNRSQCDLRIARHGRNSSYLFFFGSWWRCVIRYQRGASYRAGKVSNVRAVYPH
jgi:hypothetical protein